MNRSIRFAAIVLVFAAPPLFSQTSADNPRLKKALERFPEADADKDGVLTMAEAKAFRKKDAGQGETGDSPVEGGVTKYASDKCDKTADVWDWLFGKKRAAK